MMVDQRFKKSFLLTLILSLTLVQGLSAAFASTPARKKAEIDNLKKQIAEVDAQIASIEEDLVSLTGRLKGIESVIAAEEEKIKRLQQEIEYREGLLKNRVKQLYIQDREFGIIVLLNTDGFVDLLRSIRFLTYLSKAEAENILELKEAKKEVAEALLLLRENRRKHQEYLKAYRARITQLKALKDQLNEALQKAKREYNLMLTPAGLRSLASRSSYIKRGGGYAPDAYVPRKFVRVEPYQEYFLTSGRMPDDYVASGRKWTCYASWYGNEFHGRRTASGEIFNQWDFTVAHRSLPFGTFVLLRRGERSIVAKVTDRGPFVHGREFDLSRACAEALGFSGVARIEVEIIFPK